MIRNGMTMPMRRSLHRLAESRVGSIVYALEFCCMACWRKTHRITSAVIDTTAGELAHDLEGSQAEWANGPDEFRDAGATPSRGIADPQLTAMSADLLNRVEALEQQMAKREHVFRKLTQMLGRFVTMALNRQRNAMTVDVEGLFSGPSVCGLCRPCQMEQFSQSCGEEYNTASRAVLLFRSSCNFLYTWLGCRADAGHCASDCFWWS